MYTKLKTYNENILVPRNLEGRQEKLKQETIKLLSKETINGDFILEDYMLDIPSNLVKVKVINGSLFIPYNIIELPKWIKNITVNFIFNSTFGNLKTLKNAPKIVNSNFDCTHNKIESLKDLNTEYIGGWFNCSHNCIKSFEGLPKIKYDINATHNCLYSLKGLPEIVNGNLSIYNNKTLMSLEGLPKTINGDLDIDGLEIFVNSVKLQELKNREKDEYFYKNQLLELLENEIRDICHVSGRIHFFNVW